MPTLRPSDINVSDIKFHEVKKLDSGAKVSYVNYNGERLTFQTPVVNLPYGLSSFTNEESKDTKYDLTISFGGMDENPKVKTLYNKMKEIERCVIDKGVEKNSTWFTMKTKNDNPEIMKNLVEEMFTDIVRSYRDKTTKEISDKYPPTMKFKLPYNAKTQKFDITCHDMDTNEELDFNDIKHNLKGAKVQLIGQLTGIWISAGKFGCSLKVVMGKFRLSQMKKLNFLPDSDIENDEEEEDKDSTLEEEAVSLVKDMKIAKKEAKKVVKDSDDEEEEDDGPVEIKDDSEEDDDDMPPPPKKTGKGRAKK